MASYTYDKKSGSYVRKTSTTSYTPSKTSTSSSSSSSSSPTSSTARDVKDLPTWKGDPNDKVAIANWQASYEPGYTPKIISPRDSSGKYTSDPAKTVGYITMDKVTHAKEIAIALQNEPNIPTSIADYLVKTLASVKDSLVEPAHTAIVLTKTKEEEQKPRTLTQITPNKFAAIVAALAILIYGLLYLGSTRTK